MKLKTILCLATSIAISLNLSLAQDSDDAQMLLIHEDMVIPAQSDKYIEASKNLKQALIDNSVTSFNYRSFWLYDGSFIHVSFIDNFAALDNSPWKELSDKMGKEETQALFSQYEGTYNSHRDYIAYFHPSMSYKPEQLQEPGNNFKEWMYLYYNEGDQEAMIEVMKEWKALYEAKGIADGYTVYTAGLGHYGPVVVIHSWAKSEVEMAKRSEDHMAVLGEERMELMKKTMPLIQKQKSIRGYFMEDISYTPEQ
jgi:hypothetical protein